MSQQSFPPTPLVGNGLKGELYAPKSVELTMEEARNDSSRGANLGTFVVRVGEQNQFPHYPSSPWPDRDPMAVDLNIYLLYPPGTEKLVYSVSMNRVGPAPTPPPTWPATNEERRIQEGSVFTARLSDKTKFPNPLPTETYRAEAVVRSYVRHGLNGWKWIETGGAATLFAIRPVNLVPVLKVTGGVSIRTYVRPRRGATPEQLSQLDSAAGTSHQRAFAGLGDALYRHGTPKSGEPTRARWSVSQENVVALRHTEFRIQTGEVYENLAPAVLRDLQVTARSLSSTQTLPGGTVVTTVTSTVSFPSHAPIPTPTPRR